MADDLTYTSYGALDEPLALRRWQSSPLHPDELLFIVVHQASEAWFKVILHELDGPVAALSHDDPTGRTMAITRVNALVLIVTAHLGALGTLGARYLQRTAGRRFFPDLADVRTPLFAARLPAGSAS